MMMMRLAALSQCRAREHYESRDPVALSWSSASPVCMHQCVLARARASVVEVDAKYGAEVW